MGFQYQVHLAGYPKPVATGWVAYEPSPQALDQLLRGIMKSMGMRALDPLDNHTVGNTSPQADKITKPLDGISDPQAILPLTECVAAMRGPRTEHEPIPYKLIKPLDNGDGSKLKPKLVVGPLKDAQTFDEFVEQRRASMDTCPNCKQQSVDRTTGQCEVCDYKLPGVPSLTEVRRVMPNVVRARCEECDGEGFVEHKAVTPKAIEREEMEEHKWCEACKAHHAPDFRGCKALLVNILPKSDHLGSVIIVDDKMGKPMSQEDRDKVKQFMDGLEIKDGKVTAVQGPVHPSEEHPGTPPPLTEQQQKRFKELVTDTSTLKPDEPKPKDIDCVMCGTSLKDHRRDEPCPIKPGIAKPLDNDLAHSVGPQTTSMPCEVCGSDEWDGMTCKNCLQESPYPPVSSDPISVPESPTGTPKCDEGTESVSPLMSGDIISSKDGTRFKVHNTEERPSATDGGQLMVVIAYPLDSHRNLQIKHGVPLDTWNKATSDSEVNRLRQDVANKLCHRLPQDRIRRHKYE